ncbi:cytochrome c oxidase assembly protein [Mesorhizobium sp. B292B1B]|nr:MULTISPECIES: cytochrome c oxidase assembly protein [unclassified Mesorhizobium]MCA0014885.1 cytochrome c oxidase assembly protein [Mesorhizobium sp. B294B1A1]MCA0040995.1 cytochrome c oxidase assembly protein [Mesorhizobium sp. B292B1B]
MREAPAPVPFRRALGMVGHGKSLRALWTFASRPVTATIVHGIAIWVWHIPVLFEAALEHGVLHYAQHASFLGTGLLFWWALLPRRRQQQAYGSAVMHLFFTSLHTGLLGVLLLLSPKLWYPENAAGAAVWNLSPIEDQQLAGLVMWVPAGLIYGGAALLLAGLWITTSGTRKIAHAPWPI